MLCGVCGGLAEYFDIDPTLVRVGWVIAFFCGTFGFWAYLICAFIMPKKSDIYPACDKGLCGGGAPPPGSQRPGP